MSSLFCTDALGTPVGYFPSNSINDVAVATVSNGMPVVLYRPDLVMTANPATRLFFAYHECAHHALGHVVDSVLGASVGIEEEQEADCWAVRTMLSNGELTPMAMAAVQSDLYMYGRGDWAHLPGPQRAINLQACIADMVDLEPYIEKQKEAVKEFKALKGAAEKYDPRAGSCLAEKKGTEKKIKWNTSAEDPTVEYSFEYENTCLCPVSGNIYIATGDIPKDHKEDDHSAWVAYDVGENSISLEPGETQVVSGTLLWNLGRAIGLMPMIRRAYPDKDRFLVQVKFATPNGKCEVQAKQDDENRFCEAIKTIDRSDNELEEYLGEVIKESDYSSFSKVRYESKFLIPGVVSATIEKATRKRDGKVAFSWSGVIVDGVMSKSSAKKALMDMAERVEKCFNSPLMMRREKERTAKKIEESVEDGYDIIAISFDHYRVDEWRLILIGNEADGYSVYIDYSVTP